MGKMDGIQINHSWKTHESSGQHILLKCLFWLFPQCEWNKTYSIWLEDTYTQCQIVPHNLRAQREISCLVPPSLLLSFLKLSFKYSPCLRQLYIWLKSLHLCLLFINNTSHFVLKWQKNEPDSHSNSSERRTFIKHMNGQENWNLSWDLKDGNQWSGRG